MNKPSPAGESKDLIQLLASSLKSQYHASLDMLRQAIEACPGDLWVDKAYTNPFWRITYHTLYFVHFYLQPKASDFSPWEQHQTYIQDMDDIPAPPEFQDLGELPHRPPQTGEPYTKEQMLEYWKICDDMIDSVVDTVELSSTESGFFWYKIPKVEHQMVNLRHVQHHTAQLMERLRTRCDIGIRWTGARGRKQGG